jgi:integrase
MGRKNKKYYKDLHQQAYDKLTGMQAFGESKREAVANGTDRDKIFSFNTYQTYWKHTKYFIKWLQEKHPECTTLKSAKKHVNEWLQTRVEQGLSAYTVQTEAKALGKLYGIQPDDPEYFNPPKRERANITRSRGDRVRDQHFSVANNDELIKFCQGTGLRRSELVALKGSDLVTKEQIRKRIEALESKEGLNPGEEKQLKMLQDANLFDVEYFTYVRNGKGGRERLSPIVGKNAAQIIGRMKDTPKDAKVWQHVNSNADIHSYRSDYAVSIYKQYARPIEEIPFDRVNKGTGKKFQSEVYVCRKDESGKRLDKKAMLICSKALGHNRIEVVANNYIRGL